MFYLKGHSLAQTDYFANIEFLNGFYIFFTWKDEFLKFKVFESKLTKLKGVKYN